ncbi:MAG TPA: SagB/ThcOx family dehydrogenase [Vicinamibacterales bacterium]|nr:SagB/ThcOx family dehydrogenase [Vicinamibacterales bacterium]
MPYRRASSLIAVWSGDQLVVRNYVCGTAIPQTAVVSRLLAALTSWRTFDDLCRACSDVDGASVRAALDELVAHRIVDSSSAPTPPLERGLTGWPSWGHAAAFFHFDTKDVPFAGHSAAPEWHFRWQLEPPPRRPRREGSLALPAFRTEGELEEVLLARRSWRRFGERPLGLQAVASLLGLTWANQLWMHPREGMSFPLKTSPSGGACHSLEVYVVARGVEDLEPGVYAYDPDAHALAKHGGAWSDSQLAEALGGQEWTTRAAAVFLITAVFARVQWKYKFGRAYRVVLLEAGHFCQTFCLVATKLGLAPFCTAAMADSTIECALGIDGVSESIVYAMGVGHRPQGVSWAPWPHSTSVPRTTLPAHRSEPSQSPRPDDDEGGVL